MRKREEKQDCERPDGPSSGEAPRGEQRREDAEITQRGEHGTYDDVVASAAAGSERYPKDPRAILTACAANAATQGTTALLGTCANS